MSEGTKERKGPGPYYKKARPESRMSVRQYRKLVEELCPEEAKWVA